MLRLRLTRRAPPKDTTISPSVSGWSIFNRPTFRNFNSRKSVGTEMRPNVVQYFVAIMAGVAGCSTEAPIGVASTAATAKSAAPTATAATEGLNFWTSKLHPVKLPYEAPWKLVPESFDSPERTLLLFVDESDKSIYLLMIDPGLTQEVVSDERLFAANKAQNLAAHASNKVISESTKRLHGADYLHVRYDAWHEEHKIRMCIDSYMRRTYKWFMVIQQGFPYEGELTEKTPVPGNLAKFDGLARIFE